MCAPSSAIAAGMGLLPVGSGVVVGGAGGGSGVVFTGSKTKRQGQVGVVGLWGCGGVVGGPFSPLHTRTACSVQFASTHRHRASVSAGPEHRGVQACVSSFPPVTVSRGGPGTGGPQSSCWQMLLALASLTPSRHTRLHWPFSCTSSTPVQRQPPPASCRLGSGGKTREFGVFLPFVGYFHPGSRHSGEAVAKELLTKPLGGPQGAVPPTLTSRAQGGSSGDNCKREGDKVSVPPGWGSNSRPLVCRWLFWGKKGDSGAQARAEMLLVVPGHAALCDTGGHFCPQSSALGTEPRAGCVSTGATGQGWVFFWQEKSIFWLSRGICSHFSSSHL